MFKKSAENQGDNDRSATESTPKFEVRKRSASVLGPTLKIKGELSANEDLIIEGEIEGRIAHQDKNLTVGKSGRVTADIHAQIVEVMGQVNGDIRGDDVVRLAKTAVVKGNIHCGRIVMEDGAVFTGTIRMEGGTHRSHDAEPAQPADSGAEQASKPSLTFAKKSEKAGSAGS